MLVPELPISVSGPEEAVHFISPASPPLCAVSYPKVPSFENAKNWLWVADVAPAICEMLVSLTYLTKTPPHPVIRA